MEVLHIMAKLFQNDKFVCCIEHLPEYKFREQCNVNILHLHSVLYKHFSFLVKFSFLVLQYFNTFNGFAIKTMVGVNHIVTIWHQNCYSFSLLNGPLSYVLLTIKKKKCAAYF